MDIFKEVQWEDSKGGRIAWTSSLRGLDKRGKWHDQKIDVLSQV